MNIPKAKEILRLNLKEAGKQMPPDVYEAVEVGVEGLECIESSRSDGDLFAFKKLPHETEE